MKTGVDQVIFGKPTFKWQHTKTPGDSRYAEEYASSCHLEEENAESHRFQCDRRKSLQQSLNRNSATPELKVASVLSGRYSYLSYWPFDALELAEYVNGTPEPNRDRGNLELQHLISGTDAKLRRSTSSKGRQMLRSFCDVRVP